MEQEIKVPVNHECLGRVRIARKIFDTNMPCDEVIGNTRHEPDSR